MIATLSFANLVCSLLCWLKDCNNGQESENEETLISESKKRFTTKLLRPTCSNKSCVIQFWSVAQLRNIFYHINRGVRQGFPALRKAITTQWKIIVFFHVCWYSQSAAYTSLTFGATWSGWWMNGKAFTILNTSCLSELSRIMAAKTLKNPYRWQTMRFKHS